MFARTRAAVRNNCSKGNYMKGIYWGPYNQMVQNKKLEES